MKVLTQTEVWTYLIYWNIIFVHGIFTSFLDPAELYGASACVLVQEKGWEITTSNE